MGKRSEGRGTKGKVRYGGHKGEKRGEVQRDTVKGEVGKRKEGRGIG